MGAIQATRVEMDSRELRTAYCETIAELIDEGKPVLHLDADLMRAVGMLPYLSKYPDNIIDCGIAEGNMVSIAAGLSSEGFIPFAHSFGAFASRRAFDQVFMSCAYARQNVKIVGTDPGVGNGVNGGTHAAHEDVAMMRAVPGMTILEPTDSVMTQKLVRVAAQTPGMFYIRLFRAALPRIYGEESTFTIGEAVLLRDGGDATIIASGVEVEEALHAAQLLEAEDISVRVLDMFCVKPLDETAVLAAARDTGAIVTAENHNIIGGLGSAVAECLVEHNPVPMERVGVLDEFGEVGPTSYLKQRFGLLSGDIVSKVRKVIARKRKS